MHYFAWIIGGFVFLTASSAVEAVGDMGATSSERLPIYLIAFVLLLVSGFCFVKGGKATWEAIREQSSGSTASKSKTKSAPRPARRRSDAEFETAAGTGEEFDPDKAFARYMANRSENPLGNLSSGGLETPDQSDAPRPVFGRKAL